MKARNDFENDVPDHLFDGFCHRPYDEGLDGHLRTTPKEGDYPVVMAALDTLRLFDELKAAKYKIWELEKENAMMKKALHWK